MGRTSDTSKIRMTALEQMAQACVDAGDAGFPPAQAIQAGLIVGSHIALELNAIATSLQVIAEMKEKESST